MLQPPPHRTRPEDAQLLTRVEHRIACGVGRLRFDADLEQRYAADTRRQRLKFLTTVGICGGLIYNLFLISDWLTLNDAFTYVAIGRLCLITPMFIALLLISQRLRSRSVLEAVAALGTVTCSLMPLVVMIYSDSPYRLHYQLGMLLIMVYCTIIQQLPLRHAAAALLCMLVIQLVTTYLAGFLDFTMWKANALLYVSTVTLLLLASYFLERDQRMSYLFALRGQLLQAQLTTLVRTDPLTQLYNRRYQGEVIAATWDRAARSPQDVAVVLMDIDHFKLYNDSYGHLEGDSCLRLISHVIQHTAQAAGALAFRFGGEEILLLMPGGDADQAQALAGAVQAAIVELNIPHPAMGPDACVTVSLGVASALAPQASPDVLLGAADGALYAAKKAGRNCLRYAWPQVA